MPKITVGTTPVKLADQNSDRATIILANAGTNSRVIYVDNGKGDGLTSTNAGLRIAPGIMISLSRKIDGIQVIEPWCAVADGEGGEMYIYETSEHSRGVS